MGLAGDGYGAILADISAMCERAVQGTRVVKRLAADLTERYGEGLSASNLFSLRRFGLHSGLADLAEPLAWSHYRQLATLAAGEAAAGVQGRHLKRRPGQLGVYRLELGRRQGPVARRLLDAGFGGDLLHGCLWPVSGRCVFGAGGQGERLCAGTSLDEVGCRVISDQVSMTAWSRPACLAW